MTILGVLGLHRDYNSAFSKGQVETVKNGYSVSFQVDGHSFIFVLDKNYNLLSDSYIIGKNRVTNTYSNFRTVDGITMPFTETSGNGKEKVTFTYQSVEINKTLNTNWKEM